MSQFRRHVLVDIDGVKHEVRTCALDHKGVTVDPENADLWDLLVPIYNALVRTRVEGIPTSKHKFLELVDNVDDLDEQPAGDADELDSDLDPTRPIPSAG